MATSISEITIAGFKSIQSLEGFKLNDVNILIGANGCGKSNFISFFSFARELILGRLAKAVNKGGRADAHLFLGPKVTSQIEAEFKCTSHGYLYGYRFVLDRTADNRLIFDDERMTGQRDQEETPFVVKPFGSGHSESRLLDEHNRESDSQYKLHIGLVHMVLSSSAVYHFHDTSETSAMRTDCSAQDYGRLRADGSNLAAFLHQMEEEKADSFNLICETVRLVAPFFGRFTFRPQTRKNGTSIRLEWEQQDSDYPFQPNQLSDGTLRFIALATALLQPDPPLTTIIDEPELGLHPYAISVLAALIKSAAARTQVIVSTQSPTLLDHFEPEEIVVVNRQQGRSTFERLDAESLSEWLDDYSVGELWQKNVVQGGPVSE